MGSGSDRRMLNFFAGGLVGLIALGVILRVNMLTGEHLAPSAFADFDRVQLLQDPNATPYCFDNQAAVLLTVGADRQPGHANQDDNADGQIDDRRETGAVGSDDRCLAPTDPGYQTMLDDDQSIVISRGAFVPCDDPEIATRRRLPSVGWIVHDKK